MNRLRLLGSLVILVPLVSSCVSTPIQPLANPCAGGVGSGDKKGRVVCIDDSTPNLKTNPDPVEVWERTRYFFGNPVKIEWYTVSGKGDVTIVPAPGCVNVGKQAPGRKKEGYASALTLPVPGGKKEQRCSYDVHVKGFDPLDPEIIIIRCCTSM